MYVLYNVYNILKYKNHDIIRHRLCREWKALAFLSNKWYLLFLNIALSFFCFFVWAPQYNLFHYVNALFYVSYSYLMISLLMIVIKGKFFDAITYSFRRFGNRVSKNKDLTDDWDSKPLPSEWINPSILKMFLFQGSVLISGLLCLLAYWYTFT